MRIFWDGYRLQFSRGRLALWKDPQVGWMMGTHEVSIVGVTLLEGLMYLLTFNDRKWDQVFGSEM